MDATLARWLVSADAQAALAVAADQADPGSLRSAEALRRRWPAERAAAVLSQVTLRRRAAAKFGERAPGLFFTTDALEQATRADVASWRAGRLAAAGATAVVDLGCGIGADALAFADAGLEVVAVEADPATAVLAAANLGDRGRVLCGDAEQLATDLLADGAAVFADPARRTAAGRSWRVGDLTPPWDFVTGLLAGRLGCIKAAPGLPSNVIPDGVATTWVSHGGDLVEASLWSGPWPAGERRAVLLPAGGELVAGDRGAPVVGEVGRYLYEPDPAVIRAGAIGTLADLLGCHSVNPGIAYLAGDDLVESGFATAFEVLDSLPFDERVLRSLVRDSDIGTLEIKVRGLDVDPALLRRRLKPAGRAAATVVLTPTPAGARALLVKRVAGTG
ncbi:MAG: methyltransferase domain-containing protein [Propionibacteriaceae bacterium]|nr:methyltransferase domain-containing protein [Propionibacteriaceae bacterium]